jgi:transcriptional regulator with XRE-family HTH domain
MANSRWSLVANSIDCHPVFDGLDKVGLSGKDIADVVGVSASTVSKWRNGKTRMPGEIVALLTLVLGNQIEEVQQQFSEMGSVAGGWQLQARAGINSALDDLQTQERLNKALSTTDVREGAKMFRHWWMAKGKIDSLQSSYIGKENTVSQSG